MLYRCCQPPVYIKPPFPASDGFPEPPSPIDRRKNLASIDMAARQATSAALFELNQFVEHSFSHPADKERVKTFISTVEEALHHERESSDLATSEAGGGTAPTQVITTPVQTSGGNNKRPRPTSMEHANPGGSGM